MIEADKNRVLEAVFARINMRMLRRQFHALHLRGNAHVDRLDRSVPIVFYGNHSNWWDGLIEFFLSREVFHLDSYLMMEEQQMARYRFFRFIGAFSVNRASAREAYVSVQYASTVLTRPHRALWIYPQSDMRPNDARPLGFYSGIGHIAAALGRVQCVPVARRYEFMNEQRPEVFSDVGEPTLVERAGNPKRIAAALEETLTRHLDRLRDDVVARHLDTFSTVLEGRSSTNVLYDRVRLKDLRR